MLHTAVRFSFACSMKWTFCEVANPVPVSVSVVSMTPVRPHVLFCCALCFGMCVRVWVCALARGCVNVYVSQCWFYGAGLRDSRFYILSAQTGDQRQPWPASSMPAYFASQRSQLGPPPPSPFVWMLWTFHSSVSEVAINRTKHWL